MTEAHSRVGLLHATLRRGAAVSVVALVVTQAVSLIQTLVIARLLSPAEIGVFAAGTVLTGFLLTFAESGLGAALIQHDDLDLEDAANTVFWATAATGVLMSLAALACAPLIALVFGSDSAGLVAAATSATLLLHSMTNVPDALLQRRFDFRRRMLVDPSVAVTFAVVSITLCSVGFGVWGMVIASYASYVAWLVTAWALAGWRPGRGRPTRLLWRRLARFALPVVLSGFVERIVPMFETVAVGRSLGEAPLGHYRYGKRLSMLPGVALVQVCSYVLFPAFARIAGEPERLRRAYLRSLGYVWFVAAPCAAVLVALGEPLVVVLLGEPWRGAGVALVAMSGYSLGEAMNVASAEVIKGAGRSRLLNYMTLANLVGGVGLLVVLLPLGLVGVGLAISVTAVAVGLTGVHLARGVVGASLPEVLGRLVPAAVAAAVATAVVMPVEHLATHSDRRPVPIGVALLLLEIIGFLLAYLVVLRVFWPATLAELRSVLMSFRPGRSLPQEPPTRAQ